MTTLDFRPPDLTIRGRRGDRKTVTVGFPSAVTLVDLSCEVKASADTTQVEKEWVITAGADSQHVVMAVDLSDLEGEYVYAFQWGGRAAFGGGVVVSGDATGPSGLVDGVALELTVTDTGTIEIVVTGGGGAVDSVNTQTGVVVLTASDVGADPAGAAAAAVSGLAVEPVATDATAELLAAFAAAVSTGQRLIVRQGTYTISASLDLPSGLDVDFSGSTIRIAAGTDKAVTIMRAMGTNNITVRNAYLDGNRANRTLGTEAGSQSGEFISGNGVTTRTTNDVAKTYAADLLFENVHVTGTPNHCWEIVGAERVQIIGCSANDQGDDGFSVGGKNSSDVDLQSARMVSLIGCVAKGSTTGVLYSTNSNGFEIDDGANHVTLTGCLSENNRQGGFQMHGHLSGPAPYALTITGCVARNNAKHGIRVESQTGSLDLTRQVTVTGNTITGSGMDYGIQIRRCTDVTVHANTLTGSLLQALDSLDRCSIIGNLCGQVSVLAGSGAVAGVLIADNIVNGATGNGIVLQSIGYTIDRVTIRGNIVRTTTDNGIRVYNTGGTITNVTVAGNTVSGQTTLGIRANLVTGLTVAQNMITAPSTGVNTQCVQIESCANAIISENQTSSGTTGIRLNSSPGTTVVGNRVDAAGGEGIYFVSSADCVASGNRVSGGTYGIAGATAGNGTVIIGNVITGTSSSAIRQLSTCDYWLITGNAYRSLSVSLSGSNNTVANNQTT